MDNQMAFKSILLAGETSLRGHQGLDPWYATLLFADEVHSDMESSGPSVHWAWHRIVLNC